MEATDDLQLIERHVAAFNHGVRTGDWEPMLGNFTPDARMAFPGLELAGVDEIRAAYAKQAPDETITVSGVHDRVAAFRWDRSGGTGTMTFDLADGRVRGLTVRFDER
jgi:SnoaL-like domain